MKTSIQFLLFITIITIIVIIIQAQGGGRAVGVPGPGPMPPPIGMSKDQRRNAKAMAKLDKQVQAEQPRVYKALEEEERQEAARHAAFLQPAL